MEWADQISFLESIENETGIEPNALRNKPQFYEWMYRYIKAFELLSSRRQVGMTANPIQISEMITVATHVYIFDDIEEFVLLMSEMDNGYLESHHKKQNKPK